jgi:hypothetical protein
MSDWPARDYLYISDSKVNDWFDQRKESSSVRRILSKLGLVTTLEGSVLGSGVKVGRDTAETTLMNKLRVMEQGLNEQGVLEIDSAGKVEEQGNLDDVEQMARQKFFRGNLWMHVAPFTDIDPPLVYLTGQTSQTVVMLGGSLVHVRGRGGHQGIASEGMSSLAEPFAVIAARRAALGRSPVEAEAVPSPVAPDQWAADAIFTLEHWNTGEPMMGVEVLARREGSSAPRGAGKRVLVGSPVYVARLSG